MSFSLNDQPDEQLGKVSKTEINQKWCQSDIKTRSDTNVAYLEQWSGTTSQLMTNSFSDEVIKYGLTMLKKNSNGTKGDFKTI